VAAIGSYLDTKHHQGTWLVRMEDLDTPRCSSVAIDDILRTLDAFGVHSDESVLYQSKRTSAYEEALQHLQVSGAAYPCCCTRKEIADSEIHGIEGLVYPGTCRDGIPARREGKAWRVRTNAHSSLAPIEFDDALQGHIVQNLEREIGDFIVKRADGFYAYQLAVVVDDAFQGITNVVRGADLLTSTPRQIHLQRLLGLTTPAYMHLPVAVNETGEKLSKQTLAIPVSKSNVVATLLQVLDFLQQRPPAELADCNVRTVLEWAIKNWNAQNLISIQTLPAPVIPAQAGI
jgi:glutamyl-Q tRNA(Asp) synthetase